MSIEFINKLIDLIVKYGQRESGETWESWTCGDFMYISTDQYDHLMYKDTTIYSE